MRTLLAIAVLTVTTAEGLALVGARNGLVRPLRVPCLSRASSPTIGTAYSSLTSSTARARPLRATESDAAPAESAAVAQLRSILWKWGWLAWWPQTVLSVISGVLLLFTDSVQWPARDAAVLVGRSLALAALVASFVGVFFTWSFTRLASRLGKKPPSSVDAAAQASRLIGISTAVNLAGMAISILGAECIVGTLAAKALTQGATLVVGVSATPIQALDVLVVQASTNTIAAQFFGLLASMRLQRAASKCAESD